MNIKVTYAMSDLDKAIWKCQRHFTTDEFSPKAERIYVNGLKEPPVIDTFDWEKSMDCKAMTGLTESDYQSKYHIAWNE